MGWLRAVMGGNTWTVAQSPLVARQEVFSAPSSPVSLQLRLSGPPARRVPGGYLRRVGTVALAGVLLGAARAALDSYAGSPSGASGLDVSALTATADTVRAMLLADLDALAASSTPGGPPEERARIRRDIAYAGTRCREVVNAVYEASGSAVIYDDAPVQRIWRDANAAAQHPSFDLRRWGSTPL